MAPGKGAARSRKENLLYDPGPPVRAEELAGGLGLGKAKKTWGDEEKAG